MSTFKHPDVEELNYHAGTALRHNHDASSFQVHHLGVQFSDLNPDVLLAALLLYGCSNDAKNLCNVRFDISKIINEIDAYMNDEIKI